VLQTESVGPARFVAVHGRRSLVQGYASHSLEVWAYPVQIVREYEVAFRRQGATTEIGGAVVLRTIAYEPDSVTRTYIGPDFVVREKLFVPLDQPAAFVTYTVDSQSPLKIVIRFTPVLDLMWPGSLGGQNTSWVSAASGYLLTEATHRFFAFVASPDLVSHDAAVNSVGPESSPRRYAFAARAGGTSGNRSATVVLGLLDNTVHNVAAQVNKLLADRERLEHEAYAHYDELASGTLQIVTPDETVNRALAWSQIALDQAWVCNPSLGCGPVAGYGPSRDARRPQYEWFFAGDMLTTARALLASGRYQRVREVLLFIIKYQDPRTGMIWHELSQSASFLDWMHDYPYMFVHVDTTFQFLTAVAQYVSTSGNRQFAIDNWKSLRSAFDYCKSLLDPRDGLPRIPADKEGPNEQERLTDELGLSVNWLAASQAFAELAQLTGHTADTAQAQEFSERARTSIASRYWSVDRGHWIDAYTSFGKPVLGRRPGVVALLEGDTLNQAQRDTVLHQLASSEFETDWGTRSIASSSTGYDPNSYAEGSVWALQTAGVASAYWAEHRPYTAFPIWRSLISWTSLDSLGHMPEVLAGDYYHEQSDSVPEQTWSSAAFVSSAIEGLLGLEISQVANHVTFAPHLPADWAGITVHRIKLARGTLDLVLTRTQEGIELRVENTSPPFTLSFSPAIPFGAHFIGATVNNHGVPGRQITHEQDTHGEVQVEIPPGTTRCVLSYEGGIEISTPQMDLFPGEPSRGVKITDVQYRSPSRLVIGADVIDSVASTILLRTGEEISHVEGATLRPLRGGLSELVISPMPNGTMSSSYHHAEVVLDLARVKTNEDAK
jgi:glycogen debranching enzyme